MKRAALRHVIVIGFVAVALLSGLWIAVDDDGPAGESSSETTARPRAESIARPPELRARASSQPDPHVEPTAADPRQLLARALDTDVPISPDETIARIDRGLAESGASSEPWTHDAGRAFAQLESELRGSLGDARFAFSDPRCYAAGCVVTVTYPPDADTTSIAQTIVRSPSIMAWPGGKLASPTGEGAANRWVLLRPDSL
jgi:hypothetical protein